MHKIFGTMPDGTEVICHTLANCNGMEADIVTYGATLVALRMPIPDAERLDVVLGFNTLEDYIKAIDLPAPPYFGAAIGRWAGRIAKGHFNYKGESVQVDVNNNGNCLHGGRMGFSQRIWEVKEVSSTAITLQYYSPEGDQGFPGDLRVNVTYHLTDQNELNVQYDAATSDKTIVNLTHHSYFNLDGHQSNLTHQLLFVNAEYRLETEAMIPTGQLEPVANSKYNFITPQLCPHQIDDTFVLEETPGPAATLYSPHTKLKMEVYTNQPAVHIYVGGDCFQQLKGKKGADYHDFSGICFEAQNFPDAPNHENFPNPWLLKGDHFRHFTKYRFSHDNGIN